MFFQEIADIFFDSFSEGIRESFFAFSIDIREIEVHDSEPIFIGSWILSDIVITEQLLELICLIDTIVIVER
jgi:hypothetical protein